MSEVDTTTLERFREPIRDALQQYGDMTAGMVEFEVDAAAELSRMPESFVLAKNISDVRYLGELAAQLEVVVLAPGGGTGNESLRTVASMGEDAWGYYPRTAAAMPHSNADVHTQALLAIGSLPKDTNEVVSFAGSIEAIGFTRNVRRLTRVATFGHSSGIRSGTNEIIYPPLATKAVGYDLQNNRLGGVHALYNNSPTNTVAFALLSVSASAPIECREIFRLLKTKEPRILSPDVVARLEDEAAA